MNPKRAKPLPKGAVQSIPVESGEHVQEFKVKWSRTKKFYTQRVKEKISLHWQPMERAHDFHVVALLAFIRHRDKLCTPTFFMLSFVTVTSSAHQRFLCCVISSSAAISVPHSVRVRWYYGRWWGTVTW